MYKILSYGFMYTLLWQYNADYILYILWFFKPSDAYMYIILSQYMYHDSSVHVQFTLFSHIFTVECI